MLQSFFLGLLALAVILPIGVFFIGERSKARFRNTLAVNILSFFGVLLFAVVFLFSDAASASAAASAAGAGITDDGMRFIGAALATGMSTIGAGIATGATASAAMGALSENEKIMGKALIFVALAEGIAIYGLIISIMILG